MSDKNLKLRLYVQEKKKKKEAEIKASSLKRLQRYREVHKNEKENDSVAVSNNNNSETENREIPQKILRSRSEIGENFMALESKQKAERPSRAVDSKLRKEIQALKKQLNEQKLETETWKFKFSKQRYVYSQKMLFYRIQKRSLLNQIKYSESIISNIKYRLSSAKLRSSEKQKFALAISNFCGNRRRAPKKELSLYNDYYSRTYMKPGTKEITPTKLDRINKLNEIENFFLDD